MASAKQVSKATAQLVLACQVKSTKRYVVNLFLLVIQVKAESGSKSMEGLKVASNAVRKATDELVKAAQGTHEKTPFIKVKKDIFKEVSCKLKRRRAPHKYIHRELTLRRKC